MFVLAAEPSRQMLGRLARQTGLIVRDTSARNRQQGRQLSDRALKIDSRASVSEVFCCSKLLEERVGTGTSKTRGLLISEEGFLGV